MKVEPKPLKNRELLVQLLAHGLDEEIWSEGCDCWGKIAGVKPLKDGGLLLERPKEVRRR